MESNESIAKDDICDIVVFINSNDSVHEIYKKLYSLSMDLGYNSRYINKLLCRHKVSYDLYCHTQEICKNMNYNSICYSVTFNEDVVKVYDCILVV